MYLAHSQTIPQLPQHRTRIQVHHPHDVNSYVGLMLFVSCYVGREHGSFIGSCFMTIVFIIRFSRPVIFSSLSCFDSLAFDVLNPPPAHLRP